MRNLSISTLMVVAFSCSAACAADPSRPTSEAKGGEKVATDKVGQSRTTAPKFHIDTGMPAGHSSNTFTDIRQSMPAAAVKEELARKHELPNGQTSLLHAGGMAGIQPVSGAGAGAGSGAAAKNAQAESGAAPEVLSPSRVAIPESTGTNNTFFK